MFKNIEEFVNNTLVRENGFIVPISYTYRLYSEYCKVNNLDKVKRDIFIHVMTKIGFDTILADKEVCFTGVKLLDI